VIVIEAEDKFTDLLRNLEVWLRRRCRSQARKQCKSTTALAQFSDIR